MSDDATIAATRSFGDALAGDAAKPAALVVVAGNLVGAIYDLNADQTRVGRSAEVDLLIESAAISRVHLLIEASGDGFVVCDCGSKNGTFVNDQRITEPFTLARGDVIRLGDVALQYLPRGDPERRAYDRLNHRTQIDRFTGCYNKTWFNERIEIETRKCKAGGGPLGLLVFDLDHFKRLNDTWGHDAGDLVLKELAGLIQTHGARKQDSVARYGGEEFVVVLPDTPTQACTDVAERIRALVADHAFQYRGERLPVTVSVGVANCVADDTTASGVDLFRRADAALYKAKAAGRNQTHTEDGAQDRATPPPLR